jgi:hypothetical protein
MVCKYFVMGCPPVSVFVAVGQKGRSAVMRMVSVAARLFKSAHTTMRKVRS